MRGSPLGRLSAGAILVLAGTAVLAAPAAAATTLRSTGSPGAWSITDTVVDPGARCAYDGAAGTWYLGRVGVRGIEVQGTAAGYRSVGYRLLLQHRTPTGWHTTQRGTLVSAPASLSDWAELGRTSVMRDPDRSPNTGRYRAALRITWWDATASVQGVVVAAIDHHRRTWDGSVGPSCAARVPIPG